METVTCKKPYLFIPIEIAKRELYGKLYLSLAAVERGYKVLLGDPKRIKVFMNFFSAGVFLQKDLYPIRKDEFLRRKKHGDIIAVWDEEGLVFTSKKTYTKRMSKDTIDLADIIFSWGEYQKNLIDEAFPFQQKVASVGNPRFDLLRVDKRKFFIHESNQIIKKYGNFILINSSFSHYNSYLSKKQLHDRMIKHFGERDPVKVNDFQNQYDIEKDRYYSFIDLLKNLSSKHVDISFIIRPHPVENPAKWKQDIGSIPNIKIVNEGNIIPWCLASRAVIHNSCTTGIEAYLLDKPVIVYDVTGKDYWDFNLPNALGTRCSSIEEVEDAIFGRDSQDNYLQGGEVLKKHLASYCNDEATIKILDILDILVDEKLPKASLVKGQRVRFILKVLRLLLYEFITYLKNINDPVSKMDRLKLGRISKRKIVQRIKSMGFDNIKVRLVPFNLFILEKRMKRH